jgi:hypothetical protein
VHDGVVKSFLLTETIDQFVFPYDFNQFYYRHSRLQNGKTNVPSSRLLGVADGPLRNHRRRGGRVAHRVGECPLSGVK